MFAAHKFYDINAEIVAAECEMKPICLQRSCADTIPVKSWVDWVLPVEMAL